MGMRLDGTLVPRTVPRAVHHSTVHCGGVLCACHRQGFLACVYSAITLGGWCMHAVMRDVLCGPRAAACSGMRTPVCHM
jgi:hypothetical protein